MSNVINQEELNEFMKDGWSYPIESDGGMSPESPVFTGSITLGTRKPNLPIGENSVSCGVDTAATAYGSSAFGSLSKAGGQYSFAAGYNAVASHYTSAALGYSTKATNSNAFACGTLTTASAWSAFACGAYTTANNYCGCAVGHNNKEMDTGTSMGIPNGDIFVIGNGPDTTTKSNAFRVTYAGETYGLAAFNASGADYAEFFEWFDGNPDNEDRVGKFVTMTGNKIRVASDGDYILGIVSGLPCIIGNADEDWLGRWMRDEFGRLLTKEVEYVDEETGEKFIGWSYVENPEYDSTQKYIERKNRPEWSAVGMLGALSVYDDGTCEVDGYCQVGVDGTATKATSYMPGVTYRVIERVTDKVVKIIFR